MSTIRPTAESPTRNGRDHPVLGVRAGVVLLSFGSGAMDAFAFLRLGGIFTANMTGNLILAGMFTRPGYEWTFLGAAVAILTFAGALFVGFRLTDDVDDKAHAIHPRVPALLVASVTVQTMVVVTWPLWSNHQSDLAEMATVAMSSIALALQTAGAKRLSSVGSVTTTYVTGTLTTVMQDLADRKVTGDLVRVLSILALPAGAVVATAVIVTTPALAPGTSWAASVLALLLIRVNLKHQLSR